MKIQAGIFIAILGIFLSACETGQKKGKNSLIIDPEIEFMEDSYGTVHSYLRALKAKSVELNLLGGSSRQSLELIVSESKVMESSSYFDEKWASEKLARIIIFSLENPYVFEGIDIQVRSQEVRNYWYDQLEMTAP